MEAEPKKLKKLTRKQEKLARARVKDPNASLSELAVKAGYGGATKAASMQTAWHALQTTHVKERIKELMDRSPKLQVPSLLNKLEEGLDASKTDLFPQEVVTGYEPMKDVEGNPIKDAHGNPKMQPIKELRIIARETVDYSTRHKYLDTALELRGATEKVAGAVVNNFFSKEAIETFVEAFKRKMTPDANNP